MLIHGSLDQFSAFEFENGMHYLKRLVRTNYANWSQIVNRVSECSFLPMSAKIAPKNSQFHNSQLVISDKPGDNCILT